MERTAQLHLEAAEGGLKELVLSWFTQTQAPLIQHNGNFPDWFQGLATRKDAEDLLRDKVVGSFLIRLSDKAIGYILSYKGLDRCRHFVITQDEDGQFVISGDDETFGSLTELIQHYKVSPIQPFGEYLTSSCHQVEADELYDVVNYNAKGKSGVSVQALRTLWDQNHNHQASKGSNQSVQNQNEPPAAPPPALPPKSKSRRLTGTMSADAVSPSQALPLVPKRGIPLGFFLTGSLPETTSDEFQTDPHWAEGLGGNPIPDRDALKTADSNCPGDLYPPGVTYSNLMEGESRSRSLPQLDNSNVTQEEEDKYSRPISSAPMKRVTCHTHSLHEPHHGPRPGSSWSEQPSDSLEMLKSNPLYQLAQGPRGAQQGDGMYAEVPQSPEGLPYNTYGQISGGAAAITAVQSNTYESLEDMKTKKSKSTCSKNNMKWRKFLPDHMKK